MVRVGILTFHRSINYGAFMQAYSLLRRLAEDFPDADIEIIDYTTKRIQRKYSSNAVEYIFSSVWDLKKGNIIPISKAVVKNLLKVISSPDFLSKRQVMKNSFEKDMKKIRLSKASFFSDSYRKLFEYINSTYDIVIVGSDCVWEINNYPFPNAYYLGEELKSKKLSYAACAQGVLYKNLSEKQKEYMRKSWNTYEYLGTRDIATEILLKSVDPELSLHHNCDPTILLDMDKIPADMGTVRNKFSKAGINLGKPIIGLMGNEHVGRLCRELFGDRYQIVALYQENQYADAYLYDLSPFEWALAFKLFCVVFTDKYHGTLLSLKNGVSPLSFDYSTSEDNGGKTKIQDLYEKLDLKEHYFVGKKRYSQEEKAVVLERATDFIQNSRAEKIKNAIAKEAQTYKSFRDKLKSILEND